MDEKIHKTWNRIYDWFAKMAKKGLPDASYSSDYNLIFCDKCGQVHSKEYKCNG